MSNEVRRSTIIAVCGIDGSGKTTLVQRLGRDLTLRNAACIKKTDRDDFDRLVRFHSPIEPIPAAYFEGPLALAIRWAHAFDYLRHFEAVVRPLLNSGVLLISDRWSFCPIAFADIGTRLGKEISFLLRAVPRPDLTIFLDTPPETARARLEHRGPVVDDEHIDLLRAYHKAYSDLFQRFEGPLVRIETTTAEDVYITARRAVETELGL